MATNWRKQQLRLENAYAQAMLHEDGIVETTTKRQWKNGTRQFKLPTGEFRRNYHEKTMEKRYTSI
jgi:hypothetical protein